MSGTLFSKVEHYTIHDPRRPEKRKIIYTTKQKILELDNKQRINISICFQENVGVCTLEKNVIYIGRGENTNLQLTEVCFKLFSSVITIIKPIYGTSIGI